jgi:CcmD family protein
MGGPVWVTAVNLVIWTGIVLYLVRLDRKVEELEKDR